MKSVGSTCVNQYCEEGSDNKFTVNGQDSIDLTGSSGQFLADLKFFVEANPNQMPIRRVIVDWQDGTSMTGSVTADNYYKNRRGLDSTNSQHCDDTSPEDWGETTSACDPNYFNVQHIYTCSQAEIDNVLNDCQDSDDDGQLDESPCTGGDFGNTCVFQPRVHVRDNWGWCTGSCPNTDTTPDNSVNDGNWCYDGANDGFDSTDALNECDLNRPNNSHYSEDDPWVYYDGVISVEP